MKFRLIVPLLLATLPWAECGAQVQAREATTTLKVSARVDAVCSVTVPDLDFGLYTGAQKEVSVVLKATCSPQTLYQIGFDQGSSAGATIAQRKLASGANSLDYNVYTDSSHSTIWGNTSGQDTVGGSGTGNEESHTVYGRMPANAQALPAGNYSDTINVRLYF